VPDTGVGIQSVTTAINISFQSKAISDDASLTFHPTHSCESLSMAPSVGEPSSDIVQVALDIYRMACLRCKRPCDFLMR
jgi:hypothetical protein